MNYTQQAVVNKRFDSAVSYASPVTAWSMDMFRAEKLLGKNTTALKLSKTGNLTLEEFLNGILFSIKLKQQWAQGIESNECQINFTVPGNNEFDLIISHIEFAIAYEIDVAIVEHQETYQWLLVGLIKGCYEHLVKGKSFLSTSHPRCAMKMSMLLEKMKPYIFTDENDDVSIHVFDLADYLSTKTADEEFSAV